MSFFDPPPEPQKRYTVTLLGFWGEVRYSRTVSANSRAHAVRIVSALYDHCWNKSEIKEVE